MLAAIVGKTVGKKIRARASWGLVSSNSSDLSCEREYFMENSRPTFNNEQIGDKANLQVLLLGLFGDEKVLMPF